MRELLKIGKKPETIEAELEVHDTAVRSIMDALRNDPSNETAAPGEDSALEKKELERGIEKFLKMLPPRERGVLVMRYFDERTYEDIGKHFGAGGDRIRDIEHRALRRLRSFAHRLENHLDGQDLDRLHRWQRK